MRNSCNCEKNCCYNLVTIIRYNVGMLENYENNVAVVKYSHNC